MEATLLGTILPELSRTLTPGQSGTLASVQSIGLMAASLGAGPVLDRAGRKAGVLTGLTLVVAALLLLPHAATYHLLIVVLALLGLGGGVISTSTNTLASDLGGTNQAQMMNLLNCFFGLGGLATPALGAFLPTSTLALLITGIAIGTMALHATIPHARPAHAHRLDTAGLSGILGRPLFPLLALLLFLYVSAEIGVWNWFAVYLTGRGVPRGDALHILSFGFAAGIITGRFIAPRVLRRFRATSVTLGCSVLMSVSTLMMLQVSGTVMAGIAVFFAGLSMAPVYPTTLSLVSVAFPRGTATVIGIAVTVGWVGVAASSKIIGLIAGTDPSGLGRGLLVIPACSVLMILVSLCIRRLLPKT